MLMDWPSTGCPTQGQKFKKGGSEYGITAFDVF